MSELSCDTPFIGQIGALDLVRNLILYILLFISSVPPYTLRLNNFRSKRFSRSKLPHKMISL
jgi:hypothetical protein